MKNNWDNSLCTSASKDEKNILLRHAGFAKNITKFFLVSVYYFETLLFLLPIIYGIDSDPVRKRRYPFCAWYYYDQNSNIAFVFFYLSQVLQAYLICVGYVIGMDTFCCVAIYHSCAQLNILQSELLKIGSELKLSQKYLKKLIQKHNDHIRIFKKINQLFSKLSLYQLLTSCIVICSTGFQLIAALTSTKIDFHAFFMYMGFVIANLFQILLYCWPGNEIMGQSLQIGSAAYQSLWTNLPQDSAKAIMMMILRAQKPLIMSAGGMYEMTLKNFTKIIKVSMSCLSLLRAVNANTQEY